MWKKSLLLLPVMLLSLELYAHNPAIVFMGQPLFRSKAAPLQLTMWPLMLFNDDVKICGIHLASSPLAFQEKLYGASFGLIMGSGKLYGLNISGASFGGNNYGCSLALYNCWDDFSAVSIGLVNISRSHRPGNARNLLQIGVFNEAENGLQIGLLNHNPGAFIPWMPLFNWSSRKTEDKEVTEKGT